MRGRDFLQKVTKQTKREDCTRETFQSRTHLRDGRYSGQVDTDTLFPILLTNPSSLKTPTSFGDANHPTASVSSLDMNKKVNGENE
jgi:hypothetical protein